MGDIDVWQLLAVIAIIALGGLVQGSIGFGFALVSAGVVSLVEPEAVPGTLLLLAYPVNLFVLRRERSSVDARGLGPIIAGLVGGTVLGVVVLRSLPGDALQIAFGVAIVAAVGLSIIHPGIEPTPGAGLIGGTASGLITTVASTGGPAIVLLYQRRPGPQIRATLAAAFLVSSILSTVGLVFADRIGWLQVKLAVVAVPGLLIGLTASTPLTRRLDVGWVRPAVLVFSGAAGLAGIARGLV